MSSLRVTINSKHHATISLGGNPGMLSCLVQLMNSSDTGKGYEASFGGVDEDTEDSLDWGRVDLEVGDKIEFHILESSEASPEPSRQPYEGLDTAKDSFEDFIRSQAKGFGWEIAELNQSDTGE